MLNIPKIGNDILKVDEEQTELIDLLGDTLDQNQVDIALALSKGSGIIDYDFSEIGFVRFENGFQIAWNAVYGDLGGLPWQNVYYSDIEMGNWKKPFKKFLISFPSVNFNTYWAGQEAQNNTSAGKVRAFRPNGNVAQGWARVIAIGTWGGDNTP